MSDTEALADLLAERDRLRAALDDADSDAHRLALELECLLLDRDIPVSATSRWWESSHEALMLHRQRLNALQALADNAREMGLSYEGERAMANDLPPLPSTIYSLFFESGDAGDGDGTYQEFLDEPGYTADQMHAYARDFARAAVLAEREANVAILDQAANAAAQNNDLRAYSLLNGLAAAIRARSTP